MVGVLVHCVKELSVVVRQADYGIIYWAPMLVNAVMKRPLSFQSQTTLISLLCC